MIKLIVMVDVYAFIGLRCCMLTHVGIEKSLALLWRPSDSNAETSDSESDNES